LKVAVVIPVFKGRYFGRALESLARQTRLDFNVYVGDDASPDPIEQIARSYQGRLRLHYTRFTENLGGKDLVGQWTRCIQLTRDEPWLWLFSDDDLVSANAIELFYAAEARQGSDVFRLNTCAIDGNDREMSGIVRSPDFESSEAMAYHLLRLQRGNSMPDHFFSREIYTRKGGFVNTPFAQGADWATSILFCQDRGMHVLQDGLLSWRRSGENVSSLACKNKSETIVGHYAFIEWVLRHFQYLREHGPKHGVSYQMISDAAVRNLREVISLHYQGLPPGMHLRHLRFLRQHFRLPLAARLWHLATIVHYSRRIRRRARA
jgi:glycosyltransferase involved in cell wall biosynthesis